MKRPTKGYSGQKSLGGDLRKTRKLYSYAFHYAHLRSQEEISARVKIGKQGKELRGPTKVIQDQESSEKGSAEVSTAGATKGTASEVPVVSTGEENISTVGRTVTYRRRKQMYEIQRAQIARDEEIAKQWDEEERQRAMSEAKSKKIDWNDPSS
ncbi:hypothetical protein Tco_0340576 [Tanacetum coccineum]